MSEFIKKLAYWDGEVYLKKVAQTPWNKMTPKQREDIVNKVKDVQNSLNYIYSDQGAKLNATGQMDKATINLINKFIGEKQFKFSDYNNNYYNQNLWKDIISAANDSRKASTARETGYLQQVLPNVDKPAAQPAAEQDATNQAATPAVPAAPAAPAATAPVGRSDLILQGLKGTEAEKKEYIKKYEDNFKFLKPSVQNYIMQQPFNADKYLFLVHKYVKLTLEARNKSKSALLQKAKDAFYKRDLTTLKALSRTTPIDPKVKQKIDECISVFDMPPDNNDPKKYPDMFKGFLPG